MKPVVRKFSESNYSIGTTSRLGSRDSTNVIIRSISGRHGDFCNKGTSEIIIQDIWIICLSSGKGFGTSIFLEVFC